MVGVCLSFQETSKLFQTNFYHLTFHATVYESSTSTSLLTLGVVSLFNFNCSNRCVKKKNKQKTHTTSGPITSWEIAGETGETEETVSDFIFWGSKITANGDCSHEIKSRLLLGRKVMTDLDSIFKSRDITLPTKVRLVKAMVFPVVMYGCESWTVKKAEH